MIQGFAGHHLCVLCLFLVKVVAKWAAFVQDVHFTLGVFANRHSGLDECISGTLCLDLVDDFAILYGQVPGQCACFLMR